MNRFTFNPTRVFMAVSAMLLLVGIACSSTEEAVAPAAPVTEVSIPTAAVETKGYPRMPADDAVPQYGGTLNLPEFAVGKSHFDVLQHDGDGPTLDQTLNGYNLLVRLDPYDANAYGPELAERWVWSGAGTILTLHLREDVNWHDGTPFTSADVAYTIERMVNPKEGIISLRKGEWRQLVSVETPDDHTVVIVLQQAQPDFLATMGGYSMQIVPKHLASKLDDKGEGMKFTVVGTGPFMLKDYEPDVSWQWEKNPDYFKSGLPYLDGLSYTLIKEEELRVAALRTGRLVLPYSVNEKGNRDLLKADPNISWVQTPQNRLFSLVPSVDMAPFDDIRVRQAAALTIDHNAWIAASTPILPFILKGAGFMPGSPWALPMDRLTAIPGYNYDADIVAERAKAAALVKEAGYDGKVKFTLIEPTFDYFEKGALITQEQLNLGPFEVDIEFVEFPQYVAAIEDTRTNQAVVHSMGLKFLTVDGSIGECCTSQGRRNFGRWGVKFDVPTDVDRQLDDLFNRQSRELDQAARMDMVHDYEELFLQQYYHIVLAYAAGESFWSKKLHNHWPHMLSYNSNFHEAKWLEQ